MKDVEPGQWLLGADGKPVLVEAKSEVFYGHDCYEVEFASGERIVADAGHLWLVNARSNRKAGVLTTEQMAESHLEGSDHRPVYSIDVPAALQLPEAELPIPPYTLGAWLGDGASAENRITTHPEDDAVLDNIRADGFEVARKSRYTATIYGLRPALRTNGLRGNKHVPEVYLRASYSQRLALLQGLMDTDGTCSSEGQAFFSNTRKNLIDTVFELVRSLGLKARVYESRAKLNGKDCGPYWLVSFYPGTVPVFRLPRKQHRQRPTGKGMTTDTIVSITPVPSVPTQCIVVASDDHLFLAGRQMIPTHNSTVVTSDYVTWRIVKNPACEAYAAVQTPTVRSRPSSKEVARSCGIASRPARGVAIGCLAYVTGAMRSIRPGTMGSVKLRRSL